MVQISFAIAALFILVRGVFHLTQSSLERTPQLAQIKRRGGYLQIGVALVFVALTIGMSFVP
jgi:hypothetical protein